MSAESTSATDSATTTEAALNPLATASPLALDALFSADPLSLDDGSFNRLILEVRRRRDEFVAAEAAKAATPKAKRAKITPQDASAAAALDKPPAELDLTDLLG